jgi:hypothetical protein
LITGTEPECFPDKVGPLLTCTVFGTPRVSTRPGSRVAAAAVTCGALKKIYKVTCFVIARLRHAEVLKLNYYLFVLFILTESTSNIAIQCTVEIKPTLKRETTNFLYKHGPLLTAIIKRPICIINFPVLSPLVALTTTIISPTLKHLAQ